MWNSNCVFTIQGTILTINPVPNKLSYVCSTSLLKTLWEKDKLPVTSNLSFSHSVFYPGELFAILIKFEIVVCKLFHFGRVLEFVVWERVKRDNSKCIF